MRSNQKILRNASAIKVGGSQLASQVSPNSHSEEATIYFP